MPRTGVAGAVTAATMHQSRTQASLESENRRARNLSRGLTQASVAQAASGLNVNDDEPCSPPPHRSNSIRSSESRSFSEAQSFYSGSGSFANERKFVRRMMTSTPFDCVIGTVIVCNCVTIGLEQSWELDGKDTALFDLLEHLYLCVYLVELGLRFFAFGLRCLEDNWVKFDLFLVFFGMLTGWFLPFFTGQMGALGPFMVLRTARLMRLARTVRLLIKFRELWMLVRGLLNSASTMLYTLLMLIIIIYIFSCMSIEIITNHALAKGPDADPDFQDFVNTNFRSLPLTMITLMQFASLDNMNLLYMPLIKKCWWLSFFFIAIILVISIVLMNLITAVVVNSALEQAMQDKEALKANEERHRRRMMKDLRRLFHSLDEDHSGQVSKEEMALMTEEDKKMFAKILGTSDHVEVFNQLDVDDSGTLEIDEFCDGIYQVVISQVPIEIKRLEKQMLSLKTIVLGNQERMDRVLSHLDNSANSRQCTDDLETIVISTGRASEETKAFSAHKPSKLEPKKINEPRSGGFETLVEWREHLASDLDAWRGSLNVKLHEISNQLQRVLLEVRLSDQPQRMIAGSSHEIPEAKAQSGDIEPRFCQKDLDVGTPRWAAELKLQLADALESIREHMNDLQDRVRRTPHKSLLMI